MPGIAARTAGRVVKPPRKSRKPVQTAITEDERENADGGRDDVGEDEAEMALEDFERKVNELKKSAPSKDYAERFSTKRKSQEETLIDSLKKRRQNMTEANVELDAILSAHVDDVIRSGEVRQRKLFRYRDSTMSAFEQMVDIHTPLQDAMKLALSQKITGAQQWSQDGNDVSQAMCQLREKAKGIIVKMINESGKSEGKKKTSPDQHEWADRAKKSRKAVHRLLKAIPIPRDAD